ncbi:unnamed protein product, partial [Rotaria sordida]
MSGPTGFRCLIGCSYTNDLDSGQLQRPLAMAFDNYGNMFVTDEWRIQKFVFIMNSCAQFTTTIQAITTEITVAPSGTSNSIINSLILPT